MTLLVTAEDFKPTFLFMFKKTKSSIFRVSKVIGQLTDWQFSHVYDNRSRYTQTKDQRCDKHTKPRFDSTGLTGGEKQPMIWRKPRHVTNMVEPVLQCRWIMTQKNFHVDRSPDETGSAVLIWLLSWWMFLIVRLFLRWCYCSCKQQQARTGPAIFVRAESVASDKQIVFTLSASHKITNACCVQVTVDKWLLMFILMRKWTGRGGTTVRWQPDIRH